MTEKLLVITRPEPEATDLSEALADVFAADNAVEVLKWPLIEVKPLESEQLAEQFSDVNEKLGNSWDAIIFTSKPAVRYGLAIVAKNLDAACKVFAVGRATAGLLSEAGYQASFPDIADSEHLFELIKAELKCISQKRILIIKGRAGRDYLPQQLMAGGARVAAMDCYQRLPVAEKSTEVLQLITKRKKNVYVLITSGAILDNLIRLSSVELCQQINMIVIGRRLEALAKAKGFDSRSIIRIDKISREAISQAIK